MTKHSVLRIETTINNSRAFKVYKQGKWLPMGKNISNLNRIAEVSHIRSYVRQREDYIQMGASHIQHMQKALDQMNIKLHNVISQTVGVSGLRII